MSIFNYNEENPLKLTIFLPLSRENRRDRMIEIISGLEIPENIEVTLLIVLDNMNIDLSSIHIDHFKQVKKVSMDRYAASEFNMASRRQRIAEVFTKAQEKLPECDLVFTIEDDTEIEFNYLTKLLEDFEAVSTMTQENVGIVSGVQAGRWSYRMLGLWKLNGETLSSLPYRRIEDLEEIDAAGFYCFVTTSENFKNAKFRANEFGPDVNFGLDLSEKGLESFVDWSLICGHTQNSGETIWPNDDIIVVEFVKVNNVWIQKKP